MSYFIGILIRDRDIFLLGYSQVFFLLNIRFMVISKSYKRLV